MKITPRAAQFAVEYIIDMNAKNAAIRAGYSPVQANRQGWGLLQDPDVKALIDKALADRAKRCQITADRVLKELAAIAFFDPRKLFGPDGAPRSISDLDDATAAAVAGLDVQEGFEGTGADRVFTGYVKKYKLADKNTALGHAMKHLGMLRDSVAVTGAGDGPLEVGLSESITASLSASIKERLRG